MKNSTKKINNTDVYQFDENEPRESEQSVELTNSSVSEK